MRVCRAVLFGSGVWNWHVELGTGVFQEISMQNFNVIWIASYPKSGNTWVNGVLQQAGKKYGFPQVPMGVHSMLRNGVQPEICDAVSGRFAENACVVLKTHSAYQGKNELHHFPDMQLRTAAYIHVYRNPLDVLLSYLNYTRIEYKANVDKDGWKKCLFVEILGFQKPIEYEAWLATNLDDIPQKNLDHALDYFSDNAITLKTLAEMSGGWLEHTQSWIDAAKDIPGYSIRYEDCLVDPEQFVKLSDLFIFRRKDVLSALEYQNSKTKAFSMSGNHEETVFYNKMSAYYFTEYFSKAAINRFLNKYEASLKQLGYAKIFDLV